jgi:hypothetical protein
MIVASLAVAIVVASSAPLQECRRLEQAFDTATMPAPCTQALDDAALPVSDRVDAARLLAFALVTNGDSTAGEDAFLRLLVLSPGWALPSSASPRLRDAFGRARARLSGAGAVSVTATATAGADGWDIGADVVDALGRVASVGWSLTPTDASTPPSTGALHRDAASSRWSARVPGFGAKGCVVVARAADGSELASGPCVGFAPASAPIGSAADIPWAIVGAGAGAVVVVGVAVGALVWAVNVGPLAPPAAVTVSIE